MNRDINVTNKKSDLIPRHWDDIDIENHFKKFTRSLTIAESIQDYIASDISDTKRQEIIDYFLSFKGAAIEYDYTNLFNIYKIEHDDSYNNLCGVLEFKFTAKTKSTSKKYTTILALHRQGDAAGTLWKISDLLLTTNGLELTPVPIIQTAPPQKNEEVCIMETNQGTLKFRLFPEHAPKAVQNWIALAKSGHYNNTRFNRVIKDFVIQGGALDGSGQEDVSVFNGYFEDELDTGLYHFTGALCLGNHGPNTNGNQFYIVANQKIDNSILSRLSLPVNVQYYYLENGGLPVLDGRYTVFGQLYEGLDIVIQTANQETDDNDAPIADPTIISSIFFTANNP